ncbi:hypothetical protein FPV16_03470 [Methylobacterium sp. W2]|uniref:hypothetical protein n=1 Tax=Methylobacterium sp. W2 TaxID=2598107 RepID=UPI001D0C48D6|nr:hypothetical protein [Methylobacterium sp. W2]MCC0805286.1 hypothetical protein [Methylobacterium sp. W2]
MRIVTWMIVLVGVLGGAYGSLSQARAAPLPVAAVAGTAGTELVEKAHWRRHHWRRRHHWHRRHYWHRPHYGYRRHYWRPRYYRPIYGYHRSAYGWRRPYWHRRHHWHRHHWHRRHHHWRRFY